MNDFEERRRVIVPAQGQDYDIGTGHLTLRALNGIIDLLKTAHAVRIVSAQGPVGILVETPFGRWLSEQEVKGLRRCEYDGAKSINILNGNNPLTRDLKPLRISKERLFKVVVRNNSVAAFIPAPAAAVFQAGRLLPSEYVTACIARGAESLDDILRGVSAAGYTASPAGDGFDLAGQGNFARLIPATQFGPESPDGLASMSMQPAVLAQRPGAAIQMLMMQQQAAMRVKSARGPVLAYLVRADTSPDKALQKAREARQGASEIPPVYADFVRDRLLAHCERVLKGHAPLPLISSHINPCTVKLARIEFLDDGDLSGWEKIPLTMLEHSLPSTVRRVASTGMPQLVETGGVTLFAIVPDSVRLPAGAAVPEDSDARLAALQEYAAVRARFRMSAPVPPRRMSSDFPAARRSDPAGGDGEIIMRRLPKSNGASGGGEAPHATVPAAEPAPHHINGTRRPAAPPAAASLAPNGHDMLIEKGPREEMPVAVKRVRAVREVSGNPLIGESQFQLPVGRIVAELSEARIRHISRSGTPYSVIYKGSEIGLLLPAAAAQSIHERTGDRSRFRALAPGSFRVQMHRIRTEPDVIVRIRGADKDQLLCYVSREIFDQSGFSLSDVARPSSGCEDPELPQPHELPAAPDPVADFASAAEDRAAVSAVIASLNLECAGTITLKQIRALMKLNKATEIAQKGIPLWIVKKGVKEGILASAAVGQAICKQGGAPLQTLRVNTSHFGADHSYYRKAAGNVIFITTGQRQVPLLAYVSCEILQSRGLYKKPSQSPDGIDGDLPPDAEIIHPDLAAAPGIKTADMDLALKVARIRAIANDHQAVWILNHRERRGIIAEAAFARFLLAGNPGRFSYAVASLTRFINTMSTRKDSNAITFIKLGLDNTPVAAYIPRGVLEACGLYKKEPLPDANGAFSHANGSVHGNGGTAEATLAAAMELADAADGCAKVEVGGRKMALVTDPELLQWLEDYAKPRKAPEHRLDRRPACP